MSANHAGLQAVKKAAQVRADALESVGGLLPIFSDVEVFLATYKGDDNIRKAALELAVATLTAVERAIGFFLKHGRKSRPAAAKHTPGGVGSWANGLGRYKCSKLGTPSFPEKNTKQLWWRASA